MGEWEALYEAEHALRAAEEAAKRSGLRRAGEGIHRHWYFTGGHVVMLLEQRDAEWIAAITPLAREVFDGSRIVRLDDILALAPDGPQSPPEPR